MTAEKEENGVSYTTLKQYGAKWAVLAAMEADLTSRGASVPAETVKDLEMAHVKISSGCFSTCDANCDLNKIESHLVPVAAQYGDEYVNNWFELMEHAMKGDIDIHKIHDIPLLQPIKSQCHFLSCGC